MIKIVITQSWRGTKAHSKVQSPIVHCRITDGPIGAYAIGTTESSASRAARDLMSVHVHALNAQDAAKRKALTTGLPEHYRLAQ